MHSTCKELNERYAIIDWNRKEMLWNDYLQLNFNVLPAKTAFKSVENIKWLIKMLNHSQNFHIKHLLKLLCMKTCRQNCTSIRVGVFKFTYLNLNRLRTFSSRKCPHPNHIVQTIFVLRKFWINVHKRNDWLWVHKKRE